MPVSGGVSPPWRHGSENAGISNERGVRIPLTIAKIPE